MMKYVRKRIVENLDVIAADPGGPASTQAKRLGLVYAGYGRYLDPKTRQITHIIQDDKLVPYNNVVNTNTFVQNRSDDIGVANQVFDPDVELLHGILTKHYSATKFDNRELDSIRHFTDLGHIDINDRLSNLPAGIQAHKIERQSPEDTMPDVIGALDSATKRNRAPVDFITYTKLHPETDLSQLKPGSSFRFKGFRNTSIHLPTVLNDTDKGTMGPDGRPTISLLQLNIKKNTRGLYASDYSPTPQDREFILHRGAHVKVLHGPRTLVGSDGASGITNLQLQYYNCEVKG